MLSHVNKRIKDRRQIKLPLQKLAAQFVDKQSGPMTRNFALIYLQMAFERAEPKERFEVVSLSMLNHVQSGKPKAHLRRSKLHTK